MNKLFDDFKPIINEKIEKKLWTYIINLRDKKKIDIL